jgi:demethylmenaquinone methyltransferase / 2-methoxy-6-polyprenyl-1,4-benzoquinol methylase
MEQGRQSAIVERFFAGTGTTYDLIALLCTWGFDRWWKKRILDEIPKNPVRIMDQACGTGLLTFKIARRLPACHIIGVEMRDEYLDIARKKAQALRLKTVEFILGRAEEVLLDGPFDCITSSYLAKYAEIEILVSGIKRMLRPDGVLIMHDFTYPPNQLFSRIWEGYFRILQAVGRWRIPQWQNAFCGLPELLRRTTWVPELTQSLQKNGFKDIRLKSLTWGTSALVTARNP